MRARMEINWENVKICLICGEPRLKCLDNRHVGARYACRGLKTWVARGGAGREMLGASATRAVKTVYHLGEELEMASRKQETEPAAEAGERREIVAKQAGNAGETRPSEPLGANAAIYAWEKMSLGELAAGAAGAYAMFSRCAAESHARRPRRSIEDALPALHAAARRIIDAMQADD